jgi:outer membrane lipoprotein carrier protein
MTMSVFRPAAAPRRGLPALLLALAALLPLAFVPAFGQAAGDSDRVNAYLRGLTSLKSDFTQVTFNADRTRMMEARGTFYLQRPGRFRWEYAAPNRQVIVADGKRVYLHDLELEQVSHQSQAKALAGTPALLLADGGPIEAHFTAKSIPSTDGRDWVELTPKDQDTEVVRVELGFGGKVLDSIIMVDSFGQETRLDFAGTQRNPPLDPALFKVDEKAVQDFLSFD